MEHTNLFIQLAQSPGYNLESLAYLVYITLLERIGPVKTWVNIIYSHILSYIEEGSLLFSQISQLYA